MPFSLTPDAAANLLPPDLNELLARLPANVDRRTGADLVTQYFFKVSHRSLEGWELPTQHVNGRAITPTPKLFAEAYARLKAAPVTTSGRGSTSRQNQ
jgi:hypothetical protein